MGMLTRLLFRRAFSSAHSSAALASAYERKTPIEHILLRPDTYVGSTEISETESYIYTEKKVLDFRSITYVPALYKIVDEILVNAVDNFRRPGTGTSEVRVYIDDATGAFAVHNDGRGVPVALHPKEHIYVPELVFGHLLTGSNFDDRETKFTGGRNGFGAKLTNVFSTEFILETCDSNAGKSYRQVWRNNMQDAGEPTIVDSRTPGNKKTDFTRVFFVPDYARFGIRSKPSTFLHKGLSGLLRRRVLDLAACNRGLKVYLNDEPVEVSSFDEYAGMFYKDAEFAYAKLNDRWEVAIGGPLDVPHMSFVNSIFTSRGGTHVSLLHEHVSRKLTDILAKKHKIKIAPAQLRTHYSLFVNALIANPAFDSQTKDTLMTKQTSFADDSGLTDAAVTKLVGKVPQIVEEIAATIKSRQLAELDKKATQRSRKVKIEKLDDANYAGTDQSSKCTLILTEGDSAKALAVAGLAVVGRDHYGVFPLKGKLVNVRDANFTAVSANEELTSIKTIVGLQHSHTYETDEERASLRYGRVMLMCDQDHDGSHIKGLFINMLHHYWPALLKSGNFLDEFVTPIVKASKKGDVKDFYSLAHYDSWRKSIGEAEASTYRIKYYKGLGTSTAEEGKAYFKKLDRHRIGFVYSGPTDDDRIELAFAKNRADERKQWLTNVSDLQQEQASESHAAYVARDESVGKSLSYSDFVDKELILFSHANNIRSIPSVVDGLKPGQRKILYASFTKQLDARGAEMKVAQLSAYVAEVTAYHHGEQSLAGAIVNMAQSFVGSGNNIPLLESLGQFGTRLSGGRDAASARYIFTRLSPLARLIFRAEDDPVLTRKVEDGEVVEPEFFVPIAPTVLLNAVAGVGTGYSTDIPPFHPLHVIDNVLRRLDGKPYVPLVPWFRGHKGTVDATSSAARFISRGVCKVISPTCVEITELPVGRWTEDYKVFLEDLKVVKTFEEFHTDVEVKFKLHFERKTLTQLLGDGQTGLEKALKLDAPISLANMHIFTPAGTIARCDAATDMIDHHFPVREALYHKRKAHILSQLASEISRLQTRVVFVDAVCSGRVTLVGRNKNDVMEEVRKLVNEGSGNEQVLEMNPKTLDELLSLPLSSLTVERKAALEKEYASKKKEHDKISRTNVLDMWRKELNELREALLKLGYQP